MTKRALSAIAGFLVLGLSFSAQAQQTERPNTFTALSNSTLHFPSLTLSNAQPFSFAGAVDPSLLFAWMETSTAAPDVSLPAIVVTQPRRVATVSAAPLPDSSKEVVNPQRSNLFDYAGGEVGVLYGRSSGKFAREVEQGYIIGEVGNDKMQISAGASYERWSGRVPRFSR